MLNIILKSYHQWARPVIDGRLSSPGSSREQLFVQMLGERLDGYLIGCLKDLSAPTDFGPDQIMVEYLPSFGLTHSTPDIWLEFRLPFEGWFIANLPEIKDRLLRTMCEVQADRFARVVSGYPSIDLEVRSGLHSMGASLAQTGVASHW